MTAFNSACAAVGTQHFVTFLSEDLITSVTEQFFCRGVPRLDFLLSRYREHAVERTKLLVKLAFRIFAQSRYSLDAYIGAVLRTG